MNARRKNELPSLNAEELVEEVRGAQLGDERLNERFTKLMEAMASSPSSSFASMCASDADLEALYRFMRNDHVLWPDVLEPHFEETRLRAERAKSVLVVHDTSPFRVSDEADLASYLNTGKKGFLSHVSLVLDGREERKPLGVCAVEYVLRAKGKAKTKKNGRALSGHETAKLKKKEYGRWGRLIKQSENRLKDMDEIVHVMDREADCYELFCQLVREDCSFVVRWCRNRVAKLSEEESEDWSKVEDLLAKAKTTRLKREVRLSRRRKKTAPSSAKKTPPRQSRMASLRFASCELEFRKPATLPKKLGYPETLKLNVVHVYEPSPPEDVEPIEWVLLTNLAVKRARDVERVVDIYRQRWLIEEFFKALKTGCAYRKRNLTNRQSIFNTLASFIPIAWKALLMRQMARKATFPANRSLTELELEVLRAKAKKSGKTLGPHPTAQDVLLFIARLGGYRKSSGPPGWLTIMRGTEKFLSIVEGWKLARGEM